MKDWQKGIELDELLKLEKTWDGFNERCLSPFLEMKKNKIANSIDDKIILDTNIKDFEIIYIYFINSVIRRFLGKLIWRLVSKSNYTKKIYLKLISKSINEEQKKFFN